MKKRQHYERNGELMVQISHFNRRGDETPIMVLDPIQEGDKELTPKQYRAALKKRAKALETKSERLRKRALTIEEEEQAKRARAVNEFVAAGISTEALEILGLIRKGAGDQEVVAAGKPKAKKR